MKYKVGDIFLTRFHPGSGAELEKFRPAVIVATSDQNKDIRFVTVCAFTSRIKPRDKTIEIVIKNEALQKKSLLLTWYLRTVDTSRLVYKLGKLSSDDLVKAKTGLQKLFA